MKRFCCLVVLMLLGSSAHAGSSLSFVVGGHRIHIEAPRHCTSRSCVSVSIPGIYQTRRRHDDSDDVAATPPKPVAAPPRQVSVTPVAPPAGKSPVEPVRPAVAAAAPPAIFKPAAATQETAAPPQPAAQPPQAPATMPATASPVPATGKPVVAIRTDSDVAPGISGVSHEVEDEPAETPLGDWQTEGKKGSVRILQCGGALCGYVLDPSSNSNGEAVLINMKPKAASEWSGNIYSRDSGDTYYATIAMKGPNSLRVEACALGRFFCSANVWSRIAGKRERLISSGPSSPEPRS